jgi:hypothetical protein
MAHNGGTTIPDKTKLTVLHFEGTATAVQTALRAAIANDDVIINCSTTRKKDSNHITCTVVAIIA